MKNLKQVVEARLKESAAKSQMDDWAKPMFELVKKFFPKLKPLDLGSSDGLTVSKEIGNKILDELAKQGYKFKGDPKKLKARAVYITSKLNNKAGIAVSVDDDSPDKIIFNFYDDTYD